jgi:hypothetical protein
MTKISDVRQAGPSCEAHRSSGGAPKPTGCAEAPGIHPNWEAGRSPGRATGIVAQWGWGGVGQLPGGEHGGGDVVGRAALGDVGGGAGLAGGVLGLVAVEHRVTTTRMLGWALAIRLVACRPSGPGMRTSITTTSGWSCAAMVTAWSPSAASPMTGRPAFPAGRAARRVWLGRSRRSAPVAPGWVGCWVGLQVHHQMVPRPVVGSRPARWWRGSGWSGRR